MEICFFRYSCGGDGEVCVLWVGF
uniref:Protein NRT1/ PTR FAMILY 5.15-like n=1 Tax=Rhizophora mucronata TaxID=61149 RepID=A0A2P2P2N9_RHIMU